MLLWACSDGDLTIEAISFDGTQVYSCTSDTTTNFLYKTQGNQAFILSFAKSKLTNNVDTIMGNIPTDFQLEYRSFTAPPSSTYFCSSPPGTTPEVTSQIQARGGLVRIITQKVVDTIAKTTKYNHIITVSDLVLVNDNNEGLVNPNLNFGIYQTSK